MEAMDEAMSHFDLKEGVELVYSWLIIQTTGTDWQTGKKRAALETLTPEKQGQP